MNSSGFPFRKMTFGRVFAKSFLTAYAMNAVFHTPLISAAYEETVDFMTASIYELLGTYDLKFILLLVLCFCFYHFGGRRIPRNGKSVRISSAVLSVFFAGCILVGQSYQAVGSWDYCFGSIVNCVKFAVALVGYAVLFDTGLGLICTFLDSREFVSGKEHFFSRHAFGKAFCILAVVYLPFLLLSYPGNLCWDAIGQIEQVIGDTGYSTHHPLFHTLIMGGLVKAGESLFHSPELGLFAYMLLQDALLIAALAATIAVLSRRGASLSLLLCLLVLYCITPAYSNMASTAVKDVPYSAFVVGYVICLAMLLERPERLKSKCFTAGFVLLQVGVILFRNNGLYVILFGGIGCFVFLFKRYEPGGRLKCLLMSFAGSISAAELVLFLMVQVCNASSGSMGEMMSVPFQQTARYLQLYREEIGQEERGAIEAVLGDVDVVAAVYDPDSSDPVKALFYKDASRPELAAYWKAWLQGFAKHPAVYCEAFFQHVYGWFSPAVSNSIRYEADEYDRVRQGGLFPNAEKLLIFYYRFAARFTLLGILENIGAAVWALFFLIFYQRRHRQYEAVCAGIPLWVSLLVCMASPGFFRHPRYAFPILFSLPFLYAFTLTGTIPDKTAERNLLNEDSQRSGIN